MSGFAGIVNFDGAPVNPALVARLSDVLAARGPDARQKWVDGSVGFVFSLLRTTEEAAYEHQPFSFDQSVWIVADARIDSRPELIAKLQAKGRDAALDRPDVELILHAYHAWGESCVEHLWGDFGFVIWDASRKRLFSARDHLGIKLLYYAIAGPTVVVSNTLACIRLHPGISSLRNDSSIADFLLFEYNRDPGTTFFADIQRVPPGHTMTWGPEGHRLRRYWSLPIDEPLRYRKLDNYTEHFRELLREAVRDRMRLPKIGIFMSGGLDSPALAATAAAIDGPGAVSAYTYVFDGFCQERHYAGLVAKHLGIDLTMRDCLAEGVDPNWESGKIRTDAPPSNPMLLDRDWAFFQNVSQSNRVILCGEAPDAALYYAWRPYLAYLAKNKRWGSVVTDTMLHSILHRRVPLLPSLPRFFRERRAQGDWTSGYPRWLNPEFEARLDLPQRWASEDVPAASHPLRPAGYNSFIRARWQGYFEDLDANGTGSPLEFRHPFFDIRVLRFMLAIPAMPWCRRKYLIRRAMRGALPDSILQRDKAPLYPDPWTAQAEQVGLPPMKPGPEIGTYISEEKVPSGAPGTLANFRLAMRPRSLKYWLTNTTNIL
jgi:asparagine synthase (glutamine-hydrolysing)